MFNLTVILLFGVSRQTNATPAINTMISFSDTVPPKDTGSKIFETVEKEAYFTGGEDGWRQFLNENLNPNVPVEKGAPAGVYTVYVQFVVGTDGKLSEFKALTHQGYGLEAEVLRILRKSPPWIPAVQDNHNVKAYRKQPVTFRVVEEKRKRKKDR